jgi:hypothetical protein
MDPRHHVIVDCSLGRAHSPREIGLSHIWDGSVHIRTRGQRGIPRSMGSTGPWELSKDLVRPCQIWSLRHNLYTKLLWLRDGTGRLPKV